MRHACLLALLAALAIALVPQAGAREQRGTRSVAANRLEISQLAQRIAVHRVEARRWQRVMRPSRTLYSTTPGRIRTIASGRRVLRIWRLRALVARRQAHNPPHKHAWLCIHSFEGSWRDPSAPYYGGLQMDLEFQTTYARDLLRRKGTAEHWTPLEQMWVAERAYRTRGFWPWPNTARYCGLL